MESVVVCLLFMVFYGFCFRFVFYCFVSPLLSIVVCVCPLLSICFYCCVSPLFVV